MIMVRKRTLILILILMVIVMILTSDDFGDSRRARIYNWW